MARNTKRNPRSPPRPPGKVGPADRREIYSREREPTASVFDLPEYAKVIVVTHILELPRDLAFAAGAMVRYGAPDSVGGGFGGEVWAALLQMPEAPPGDLQPATRLVFRRAQVRFPLPLEAADKCFGHFEEALMSRAARKHRQRVLGTASKAGLRSYKTVVAVSRFLAPSEWPRTGHEQLECCLRELRSCLNDLNDVIVATSLHRGDPRLLPLSLGDVPSLCPVVIEIAPMSQERRVGASFMYEIHTDVTPVPAPLAAALPDLDLASELVTLKNRDRFPLFAFLELLQTAFAAEIAHRYGPGVVALGTAVDVLISTLIRELAEARGEPAVTWQGILDAPLKNQFEHHLGRYIGSRVDLTDPTNLFGSWWLNGYALRNRIVHDGHKPSSAEAEAAFASAIAMINHIGERLRADLDTEWIGVQIEIRAP